MSQMQKMGFDSMMKIYSRTVLLSSCLFLQTILGLYAQEEVKGRVLSSTGDSLPNASVVMLSCQDSAILTHSISNSSGNFVLQPKILPQRYILRVTYIGFYPQEKEYAIREVGNIVLEENIQSLKDVVVSPSEMKDFATHNSYRLPPTKTQNYTTFLESLALVPELTVTGWRTLTASDGGSVLTLLNGIKVDEKELLALDKRDVLRVDVYKNPPARFISMGASMVINVITNRNLQGGNVFVDLTNAITRLDATNFLSAAYNVNKWRFTTSYDNTLSRSTYRQDEKLSYHYAGKDYHKKKVGIESPWEKFQHNVKFGLMKTWSNDLQLNATGALSLYREFSDYQQKVLSLDVDTQKSHSPIRMRWHAYTWDLYLAKMFAKKRELLFDFSGSIHKSQLNSSYVEERSTGEQVFNAYSEVEGLKRSLTADLQYSRFFSKATFKLGVRDNLSINNQELQTNEVTSPSTSYTTVNVLDIYSDVSASIGKWQLYSSVGLQQVNSYSPKFNQDYSFFSIKPNLRTYYRASKPLNLFVFYSLDNIVPNISMLTETPIYKDYKYVFIGNNQLRPYHKHQFTAGGTFKSNYLLAAMNLSYSFAKDAILPFFELRKEYLAETYRNLSSQLDFLIAWQVNYMPLGNSKLSLSSWGNYVLGNINNDGNRWKNNYLRYFFQVSYNDKHWSTLLMYQSASNYMQGLWLIKAPTATVAEINYKTKWGINIGIGGKYLFTKEYKNGQKTHPDALLQLDRWNTSRRTANTIYLKLSYNFSFGRKFDGTHQKINNKHSDTGLLTR